jgi:hypothetical protein
VADSEEKDQTPQEEKPVGPTSLIVRTPFGKEGFREALKGPDGRFIARKTQATKKDVQDLLADFLLTKVERGKDGKMKKREKTRLQEQFEAMDDMVHNKDPKAAPAAVKAAELMWVYLFGKPSQSDKDRAANELAGVKYVVINAQPLPNPAVVNADEQKKPTKPSFIDDVTFLPPDRDKE